MRRPARMIFAEQINVLPFARPTKLTFSDTVTLPRRFSGSGSKTPQNPVAASISDAVTPPWTPPWRFL